MNNGSKFWEVREGIIGKTLSILSSVLYVSDRTKLNLHTYNYYTRTCTL